MTGKLALLSGALVFIAGITAAHGAEAKMPTAEIGNQKIKLEVAQTKEEITRGLMGRQSLAQDHGMVFLFHPASEERFWMAHCFISLDMLFVRDGKIVKIFENVPPCREENTDRCPTYPAATEPAIVVSEVVEVNGGYAKAHGIKEGDAIKFVFERGKADQK
jgi:uncharacterized membrane protein (UPF0127 family)